MLSWYDIRAANRFSLFVFFFFTNEYLLFVIKIKKKNDAKVNLEFSLEFGFRTSMYHNRPFALRVHVTSFL